MPKRKHNKIKHKKRHKKKHTQKHAQKHTQKHTQKTHKNNKLGRGRKPTLTSQSKEVIEAASKLIPQPIRPKPTFRDHGSELRRRMFGLKRLPNDLKPVEENMQPQSPKSKYNLRQTTEKVKEDSYKRARKKFIERQKKQEEKAIVRYYKSLRKPEEEQLQRLMNMRDDSRLILNKKNTLGKLMRPAVEKDIKTRKLITRRAARRAARQSARQKTRKNRSAPPAAPAPPLQKKQIFLPKRQIIEGKYRKK